MMATSVSHIPIILQLLLLITSSIFSKSMNAVCNEKDRQILLVFKQDILDPSDWLSSWSTEKDCCNWTGIQCANITGKVTKISLQCPEFVCLEGEINLSILLELEFLKFLDLSWNNFTTIYIPVDSQISHPHASFSTIHYLDLSYNFYLYTNNLSWLSSVSSLKYLNLSGIDLHHGTSWLKSITMLPSLLELHLRYCQLEYIRPPLGWYVNSTSLELLDLSHNNLNSKIFQWVSNISYSLSYLFLQSNLLKGQLQDSLNLQNLELLDLRNNELNGSIPNWLFTYENLKYLYLDHNFFSGPIPIALGNLSSLIELDLSWNRLNGSLPPSIWQFLNLQYLSIGGNSLLDGVVSEDNFDKLLNLKLLDLSSSNFAFRWDPKWIPPFQLSYIYFGYSKLGPILPSWLYTQRFIEDLNIANSGISSIDQDKFWKMAAIISRKLDLSNNSIGGDISNVIINTPWIELQNNNFSGGLPFISPNVTIIIMFNNYFSGSISPLLCHEMNGRNNLQLLNISYNLLSGELPADCWLRWKSLLYVNLASNDLTGKIPNSMGFLPNLKSLHLHHNRFFGGIPTSLQNNDNLVLLDLEGNNFSGSLPNRMGQNMKALVLRSNQFSGIIPSQLCQVTSLIILDLADNRLSGPIPKCLSNITAMVSREDSTTEGYIAIANSFTTSVDSLFLLTKGQEGMYIMNLKLVRFFDLSCNDLFGLIPVELFPLSALQFLNLSQNHLIGKLPPEIGGMINLESLDLSRNLLSGEIPQGISNLTFLAVLNLSYNHFSGRIPLGTQLQSFEEYSYIGNAELCGVPLKKSCAEEKTHDGVGAMQESEDKSEKEGFYMGMGVGFATSFWAVCVALFFKRSWRHAYFRFLNNMNDRLYVMVVLKMNHFR